METVTSKDGTRIAYDRLGEGPPVVLVCGGAVDRMADAAVAQELSSDFTAGPGPFLVEKLPALEARMQDPRRAGSRVFSAPGCSSSLELGGVVVPASPGERDSAENAHRWQASARWVLRANRARTTRLVPDAFVIGAVPA